MSERQNPGVIDTATNPEARERAQESVNALRELISSPNVSTGRNTRVIEERVDVVGPDGQPDTRRERLNPEDDERQQVQARVETEQGYYPVTISFPENQDPPTEFRVSIELSADAAVVNTGNFALAGAMEAGFSRFEAVRLRDFTFDSEAGSTSVTEQDFTRLSGSRTLRPKLGGRPDSHDMTSTEAGELMAMLGKAKLGENGDGQTVEALIPNWDKLVAGE